VSKTWFRQTPPQILHDVTDAYDFFQERFNHFKFEFSKDMKTADLETVAGIMSPSALKWFKDEHQAILEETAKSKRQAEAQSKNEHREMFLREICRRGSKRSCEFSVCDVSGDSDRSGEW
jgi:hypothetical protein